MVSPASRQTSTSRVASWAPVLPHDWKNSLPPPKVPVPRLRTGTLNPERPSSLYSTPFLPDSPGEVGGDLAGRLRRDAVGGARPRRQLEGHPQRLAAGPVAGGERRSPPVLADRQQVQTGDGF